MKDKILKEVENYYSEKIRKFGNSPNGVDWNSTDGQHLRFQQLCNVINKASFSLLDYGCGYGELINFLEHNGYSDFNYFGYDISPEMIDTAKELFKHKLKVTFDMNLGQTQFDYVIASGIFNVTANGINEQEWLDYILNTLNQMNNLSKHGYSFNVLTKYSDREFMKDYLYYADPCFLFDYCKQHHSKNVALLHDYHLYEFTLIVRK
ncbi:MAG: class I SAM-dependent methyltransferase [Chitinophagales bacterium]|nr:class I SAM-dependent methyltransferase [Chitinophagales bacterium]